MTLSDLSRGDTSGLSTEARLAALENYADLLAEQLEFAVATLEKKIAAQTGKE